MKIRLIHQIISFSYNNLIVQKSNWDRPAKKVVLKTNFRFLFKRSYSSCNSKFSINNKSSLLTRVKNFFFSYNYSHLPIHTHPLLLYYYSTFTLTFVCVNLVSHLLPTLLSLLHQHFALVDFVTTTFVCSSLHQTPLQVHISFYSFKNVGLHFV